MISNCCLPHDDDDETMTMETIEGLNRSLQDHRRSEGKLSGGKSLGD